MLFAFSQHLPVLGIQNILLSVVQRWWLWKHLLSLSSELNVALIVTNRACVEHEGGFPDKSLLYVWISLCGPCSQPGPMVRLGLSLASLDQMNLRICCIIAIIVPLTKVPRPVFMKKQRLKAFLFQHKSLAPTKNSSQWSHFNSVAESFNRTTSYWKPSLLLRGADCRASGCPRQRIIYSLSIRKQSLWVLWT